MTTRNRFHYHHLFHVSHTLNNRHISTGSYLLADAAANTEVTVAWTVIGEDICGLSFAYGIPLAGTELMVAVEGVGTIWSSITAPRPAMGSGWSHHMLQVGLQDVEVIGNRSLFYLARFASSGMFYVALDNITLHPCTDCATPGTCACMWVHVHVDTCACGYMCMWIHVHVDTCACGYMCMWIHVHVVNVDVYCSLHLDLLHLWPFLFA